MSDALAFLSPSARAALEELIDSRVAAALHEHDSAAATPQPYMTIPEAATFLRCSRQRVDDLLSQRRLRRYKDGGRTLIRRDQLEAYIEGRRP